MKWRNVKTIVSITLFIVIGLCSMSMIIDILMPPIGTYWAVQTGMKDVHQYKNEYDVIFCGTSLAISNINNQELYDSFGIKAISIAEPEQPIYLTKYTLEDALKYQKPKIVFFDTRALFYSEESTKNKVLNMSEGIVHNSIDAIDSFEVKLNAIKNTQKYDEEIDIWEYISKLYYSHNNWSNLKTENFRDVYKNECINGNVMICEVDYNHIDKDNTMDANIELVVENHFAEMVEQCDRKNIDFIMLTCYLDLTEEQCAALQELSEKYDIKHLNINDVLSEINFDSATDFNLYDAVHFNLNGAIKWSDYIGEFITKNYKLNYNRNNIRYNEQSNLFQENKRYIETKIELLKCPDFYSYLGVLRKLDYKENTVFIAICDEATESLDQAGIELLKQLGLDSEFADQYRTSYVAVLDKTGCTEKISLTSTVFLEGSIGNLTYSVVSGGLTSGMDAASIMINKIEYIPKERGFNIAVYNNNLNKIVNVSYFDTWAESNPATCRVLVQDDMKIKQKEIGVNVWLNI